MMQARRALLVVHTNTYFAGLLDVAHMLKGSGLYEPVFFFAQPYPTIDRDLAVCCADGISYLGEAGGRIETRQPVKRLRAVPSRLHARVNSLVGRAKAKLSDNVLSELRSLHQRERSVRQLIREEHAALLVLAGDMIGYDTPAFIKAAHAESIPAVVVPGWMASAREAAEAIMYNPEYSLRRWSNRIAGKLYPRWQYAHKGRQLLRLPARQVLAREWLSLAPPLPWVLHSGYADAIAVESEAMRTYCVSEGLPAEKVVLTGSLAHDQMAAQRSNAAAGRAELYQRLGLPQHRPMLLSALPPDQLYMEGGRPECEFQTYTALVKFWVQSLAAVPDHNVVISLHPSVKYDDMAYIEQWGVRIAPERTPLLIPLCDLYVASISATIQWAIACGKPVLNYDVYRYRYTDYVGVAGVVAVEEQDEYLSLLRRLTTDRGFYAEIAARQAACAPQWGRLDGRAGERILQLFDRLIARYGGAGQSEGPSLSTDEAGRR